MERVQRLVEGGASLHARDPSGMTPFLVACSNDSVEIVDYLFDYDTSVLYDRTRWSENALHVACTNGSLYVTEWLLSLTQLDYHDFIALREHTV